jgi:uncharacterized protein YecE (DUF72 family)
MSTRRADRTLPRRGTARVGCSGWHYKQWRGTIYPDDLPPSEWLHQYARRFCTVELNNSFYRLPPAETFADWRAQVPRTFVFAVKASRFLTHIKRLRDPEEPLARLFDRLQPLDWTMGPVLYQMPPRWVPDPDRLEMFLASLPRSLDPQGRVPVRHVIEMRDSRGYDPKVLAQLRAYRVSLCVHDMPGSEAPRIANGEIVYLRFHGYGAKYGGSYPSDVLQEWADWINDALTRGLDAYVYFNNDLGGAAVSDAERFRALVDGQSPARRSAVRNGRRLASA